MDGAHWEKDLKAINGSYMFFLRAALRDQFTVALQTMRLRNRRLAQRIEALDNAQMRRLNAMLVAPVLQIDEVMAMEVIVDYAMEEGGEDSGAPYSDNRPDQLRWKAGSLGHEVNQRWLSTMSEINQAVLVVVRNGIRDDLARVTATFGLRNARFIRRISGMDIGQLIRLSRAMPLSLIQLNETLPLEVLVDRVGHGGEQEELQMSMMAHAASIGFYRTDTQGAAA